VPGMREIKGSVLGRLPYYLVWQHCTSLFPPLLIAFGSFDPPSHSLCSCRLDRRELAGFGAVLMTLPMALCYRRPLPHAFRAAMRCFSRWPVPKHPIYRGGIFAASFLALCQIFSACFESRKQ